MKKRTVIAGLGLILTLLVVFIFARSEPRPIYSENTSPKIHKDKCEEVVIGYIDSDELILTYDYVDLCNVIKDHLEISDVSVLYLEVDIDSYWLSGQSTDGTDFAYSLNEQEGSLYVYDKGSFQSCKRIKPCTGSTLVKNSELSGYCECNKCQCNHDNPNSHHSCSHTITSGSSGFVNALCE